MALTLLIKPASGACNLRCRYCFYREEVSLRCDGERGLMYRETALSLIQSAFTRSGDVCFAFQGGEPMLAGLLFFRRFTETARSLHSGKGQLSFTVQTNGTLVDEAWAAFFAKENYLVGLSLDGPRDIHEKNRPESFDGAMRALSLLQNAGAQVNVLTVVTAQMAKRPEAVYTFLKKQGPLWQQFIPCMSPMESAEKAPWELTGALWGSFLCRLFDLWYKDFTSGHPVPNRLFENWAGMLAGLPPEECGLSGTCAPQYVVEADGAVYPCDFYCLDEWQLGNIRTDTLESMDEKRKALGFIPRSSKLSEECRKCRVYPLCRGGCLRYRDENGRNLLCSGYRTFFDHAGERLWKLSRLISYRT